MKFFFSFFLKFLIILFFLGDFPWPTSVSTWRPTGRDLETCPQPNGFVCLFVSLLLFRASNFTIFSCRRNRRCWPRRTMAANEMKRGVNKFFFFCFPKKSKTERKKERKGIRSRKKMMRTFYFLFFFFLRPAKNPLRGWETREIQCRYRCRFVGRR